MTIDDLCAELRNYFLPDYKNPEKYIHEGTFEISNGHIQNLPFLQSGQYYRILGSVFNNGVHIYGSNEQLIDETFTGMIWEMAVPKDVENGLAELNAVNTKLDADVTADNGFTSESFGGYSYSKRSGLSEGLLEQRKRAMDALKSKYRRLTIL